MFNFSFIFVCLYFKWILIFQNDIKIQYIESYGNLHFIRSKSKKLGPFKKNYNVIFLDKLIILKIIMIFQLEDACEE